MYVNHFGLSRLAFQRASEPDQFFRSEGFEATLRALHEGIRRDCGLMLLTGDSGVGKTATTQLLQRELCGNFHFAAFDRRIFDDDEAESDGAPTVDGVEDLVFHRLAEASRRRPDPSVPMLAVVDEAHMGSAVDLMGLLWAIARLRAGANGADRPGLVLVGDTELTQRFRAAPLRTLERDIRLQCCVPPLPPGQVSRYIRFHIERAGYRGEALFSDAAIAYVEECSRGIPHLINNICGLALVIAAEDDVYQVTDAIVRDAANDLLVPQHTLESAAQFESLSFDEEPVSAPERDTHRVDIPERVEDLDLYLGEARVGDAGSRGSESSGGWPRHRAERAWRGVAGARQTLGPWLQSARDAIEQRLRKPWRDARIEHRWGSYLTWIDHRSEHVWAAVRRARERLPRGHSVLAALERLWKKPLLDAEARPSEGSASTSTKSAKRTLLQMWSLGAAVAFSSVMAVFAVMIWTLVLTHVWSAAPESVAQERSAPMTLEEEPYEHAPVATGVLIDDGETSAYQIVALTVRESWGDERAEALPQASASENAGTPENGNPSNPESPPHTSKAPILSATDSESRVTTEAVTEPEVSSKAHDEPHDAGSGNPETRITIDQPSPMKTHVIAPGESLWSISRHYKTTIDRLRSFNELSDTHVIQPGQILHVESAAGQVQMSVAWHTVRPGENLFQIGRRYGISITEITALNSLADPSQLRIGQRLRVSAARPASRQAKEKRDAAQAASQG